VTHDETAAPQNRDTSAALVYHSATNHSPESVRSSGHRLDWANQPRPYKLYADLPPLPLPDPAATDVPALTAIAGQMARPRSAPDLASLGSLLHYSNGVTRRLEFNGQIMQFRAAACTGALYHIELYLVCGELDGLSAGVYQFAGHDGSLRMLRSGDLRGALVEATAGQDAVTQAPAVIVCTSTYWRNSWKYQARTYRHCFWDAGTVLANLLAVAAAHGLDASIVAGFVDAEVNLLLDLDPEREVALALIPLGRGAEPPNTPGTPVVPLGLQTLPYSRIEVDYPAIRRIHAASSLLAPSEVARWRGHGPLQPPASAARLENSDAAESARSIETTIRRRGSARAFGEEGIGLGPLNAILRTACAPLPADYRETPSSALSDPFLIVRSVDGLTPGAYVWRRQTQSMELIRAGDFIREAWHLDLGQALAAQAAVDVYFLADLEPALARLGNRGYRAAQLDAAVEAGRAYLAAYALRLGATGLTFFDDDVIDFFGPPAAGRSVMFLIAIGVPARPG
jgi:SagB-type dehydrogenase family enzyme